VSGVPDRAGRRRFIVVEGPIGVGKTSLAGRLAERLDSELLLERAEENPFLQRFYADPRGAAFPAQLYFLFQRSQQLDALRQGDLFREALVADFLFDKDRLFARLNLDAHELALYEQVYRRMVVEAPAPDLVVYLQAPAEVLMQRIARRGRPGEEHIEPAYLERISDAYLEFFYHFNAAPLLIVNAAEINPVDSEADFAQLLRRIETVDAGKHYFNPAPLGLG
jgi:deoxyadenosine/deoxycytidine kinase